MPEATPDFYNVMPEKNIYFKINGAGRELQHHFDLTFIILLHSAK